MPSIAEQLEAARTLHRAGRMQEAVTLYQRVLAASPTHVDAHYLLGAVWSSLGDLDQAAACYLRVIELAPGVAEAHYNLGTIQMRQGRLDQAAEKFRQAITIKPNYVEALNNLGVALISQKRFAEGADYSRQAIALRPNNVEAHVNLGAALAGQGRPSEAADCFQAAVTLSPDYADGWFNLGKALADAGQLDRADAAYTRAIELKPKHVESRLGRVAVWRKQRRLREAESEARVVLELQPDLAPAHCDLGCILADQFQLDEALACYRRAVDLLPDFAEAHLDIAVLLAGQNKLDAALASFRRCFEIRPDWAGAHLDHAMALLCAGRFAAGWAEFEWRLKCPNVPAGRVPFPRWTGDSLAGRTIFLRGEQGNGDTIQCVRFAETLKRQGARVIVGCSSPLARLMAASPYVDAVVTKDDPLPPCDVYLPMLSLPLLLGIMLENIPANIPYLSVDAETLERGRNELGASAEFKIGVAWQGNPAYPCDAQRSFPLAALAPLAELPGVRLISLQHGPGREQLADVADRWPITDLGDRLGDFQHAAGIIHALDLVISCDSAPVHLAGALGVPAWLALCAAPHWVWMFDRDDSPWYPSVRLFRQNRLGDWPPVFQNMRQALVAKLAEKRG